MEDYEAMKLGPDLLSLLGSGEYGHWMLIHGHKHFPKIEYGPGGARAPVIFSAGSLSGLIHPQVQSLTRNQFYIIEIHLERLATIGLVGTGRAWDYIPGHGWSEAGPESGLPPTFGFGCRADPGVLATRVAELGSSVKKWATVLESIPELRYTLPRDFKQFETELRGQHGRVVLKVDGEPTQVGKAYD